LGLGVNTIRRIAGCGTVTSFYLRRSLSVIATIVFQGMWLCAFSKWRERCSYHPCAVTLALYDVLLVYGSLRTLAFSLYQGNCNAKASDASHSESFVALK
jgi:hypothetical protein